MLETKSRSIQPSASIYVSYLREFLRLIWIVNVQRIDMADSIENFLRHSLIYKYKYIYKYNIHTYVIYYIVH